MANYLIINKVSTVGTCLFSEWHNLTSTCCQTSNSEACNFYSFVNPSLDYPEDESNGSQCGNLVEFYSDNWLDTTAVETYNIYQDCYIPSDPRYDNLLYYYIPFDPKFDTSLFLFQSKFSEKIQTVCFTVKKQKKFWT